MGKALSLHGLSGRFRSLLETREKTVATALGAAGAAGLAYSTLVEPRWLEEQRLVLRLPGAEPAIDGVRIAHLTDLHFGMRGLPRATIRAAIARIADAKPDLILVTGDLVHHGRWENDLAMLAPLARVAPTFAVWGNHDLWGSTGDRAQLVASLANMDIRVLENEVATLEPRAGVVLAIGGIDDPFAGTDDAPAVLAAMTARSAGVAARLLLLHDPGQLPRLPPRSFDLVLSGHTHGGQVRLLPRKNKTFLDFGMIVGGLDAPYATGIHLINGNPLYVSNGLGVSGAPVRFLARPGFATITLSAATGSRDDLESARLVRIGPRS